MPVRDPRDMKIVEVIKPESFPITESAPFPYSRGLEEIEFQQDRFELSQEKHDELFNIFLLAKKDRSAPLGPFDEADVKETIKNKLSKWSYKDLMRARYQLEKEDPEAIFNLRGEEEIFDAITDTYHGPNGSRRRNAR